MFPHLSGWHAGSFGGNDSQFSEVLDTLQTTFPCPILNIKSVKRKKTPLSELFLCFLCNTFLGKRFFGGGKTTLTEHFFRWGFCEKFLSQGLSAALKTAIKLPSKHKFAQIGSETTKRISLFYIFQNIWSYWPRVAKTPSARQQCWPESFCKSGKFLRHVHYWLKNFRIIWKMSRCYTK